MQFLLVLRHMRKSKIDMRKWSNCLRRVNAGARFPSPEQNRTKVKGWQIKENVLSSCVICFPPGTRVAATRTIFFPGPSGIFLNLLDLLEPSVTFWNLLETSGTFFNLLEPSVRFSILPDLGAINSYWKRQKTLEVENERTVKKFQVQVALKCLPTVKFHL